MSSQTPPPFDPLTFRPTIDRLGEWTAETVPWKRVEIPRLHRRDEFTPGGGWGRNGWNELYKGESYQASYVSLPMRLIEEYNVEVIYKGCSMKLLRHAQPAFTKPRSWSSPDLVGFFRWMGVSM